LIRLLLPLASVSVFFALSWATVRVVRPREPRRFFLACALLLLVALALAYTARWPLDRTEDVLGLASCLLLHALACLTLWNVFYSLLWGFSGSLMHDLLNDAALRTEQCLLRSYEGDGDLDRIMARRLPNLVHGGWVQLHEGMLRLTPKGRVIAWGTLAAFKFFSLGMGGGIK
jgi:hypothetical protein